MTDSDIEAIRMQKMQQYQEELKRRAMEQQRQAELEVQKAAILRKILTPEARARLTNIKMANPELAAKVESSLIALYASGRLGRRITDQDLKMILAKLSPKRETKITIKRK